jgi:hypothetical protein
MASSKDYPVVRYGTPGNAFQPINQPMGLNVAVAGGALAITDSVTGLIKDAAGTLNSADVVWGLIMQAQTGASTTNTPCEIETGAFFLPSDGSLAQAQVGDSVYVSGEQQVTLNAGVGKPFAGTLIKVDTTQYGGYAVKVAGKAAGGP